MHATVASGLGASYLQIWSNGGGLRTLMCLLYLTSCAVVVPMAMGYLRILNLHTTVTFPNCWLWLLPNLTFLIPMVNRAEYVSKGHHRMNTQNIDLTSVLLIKNGSLNGFWPNKLGITLRKLCGFLFRKELLSPDLMRQAWQFRGLSRELRIKNIFTRGRWQF